MSYPHLGIATWRLTMKTIDARMQRPPRSLRYFLVSAALYALLSYLAVQLVYDWEMDRAGLHAAGFDPARIFHNTLSVHLISFVVWLIIAGATAVLVHRFQSTLTVALDDAQARAAELSLISEVGTAMTEPLPPLQIAAAFLDRARWAIAPRATTVVFAFDDAKRSIRPIASDGPRAGEVHDAPYPVAALPPEVRGSLREGFRPLLIGDTDAEPGLWSCLAQCFPHLTGTRCFCLIPLVSRDRPVGAIVVGDAEPHQIDEHRVRLLTTLSHHLAGALDNAGLVAAAEARAEREARVNRVAHEARASLSPDVVLNRTIAALGSASESSRALVWLGANLDEIRVAAEWNAPGVPPLGADAAVSTRPTVTLAATRWQTVAIADARLESGLGDPSPAQPGDLPADRALAALATPIGLGGHLVGVLVLHQVGAPRHWSSDDVYLVEAVARDLATAMETMRLFEARERESARLLALYHASMILGAHTDRESVLDEIVRLAGELVDGDDATFFGWNSAAAALCHPRGATAGDQEAAVALRAIATRSVAIENDLPNGGVVAAPLVRGQEPLGVLLLRSRDPVRRFTEQVGYLLSLFGDQAAAAITTAEAFARQQRAVEELQRLNKAKSDFVSIVAHEFRTPLTGIQGFSEIIRDYDLTAEEIKEYAADINADARRLTRMINAQLDLDRLQSGRIELHREPVDLNRLLVEVVDLTRPTAPRHRLVTRLDEVLPPLSGDHDRLIQVITNLLGNAIKYSPDGGEVVVATRVAGRQIHACVQDHGVGIPADALERIFEPYSRIETGASGQIAGTGLGLPIVRQIVDLHGGRVWVESVLGRGSTFHVTLPLDGHDAAEDRNDGHDRLL